MPLPHMHGYVPSRAPMAQRMMALINISRGMDLFVNFPEKFILLDAREDQRESIVHFMYSSISIEQFKKLNIPPPNTEQCSGCSKSYTCNETFNN